MPAPGDRPGSGGTQQPESIAISGRNGQETTDNPPLTLISPRSETKTGATGAHLGPRPCIDAAGGLSQPHQTVSPPSNPAVTTTSRNHARPYCPPPRKAQSGRTENRAKSGEVQVDERDLPHEAVEQPPQPSPFDTDVGRGVHRGRPAFPPHHSTFNFELPPSHPTYSVSPSALPHSQPSTSLPWTRPPSTRPPSVRPPPTRPLPAHPPSARSPLTTSRYQASTPRVNGLSYFPRSHHFSIQNLTANTTIAHTKSVYEHLDPHISHGAAHDSSERCDAPTCHEETRVAVREEIVGWIKYGDGQEVPQKVLWLSGPAGAGKTAIAGSVSEACKDEGLLAASFFFSSFSRSVDRRSKRCVITTIASHLAEHKVLHEFAAQLLISIEGNPSIFHKRLKEQAECLLLGPLRAIRGYCDTTTWPKGIIIDGLDEMEAEQYHDPARDRTTRENDSDQLEILEVLFSLAVDPAFPFRIFISSRPERIIEEFFSTNAQTSTFKLFLDSQYNPDADIARFLQAKFAGIRFRFSIIDSSWPGEDAVDRIVDMSSGQFIVPTTVIRWIDAGVPQQRLDDVLQLKVVNAGKNPFATLDALYHHILKRSHNPDGDPHLIVKWIRCFTSDASNDPRSPATFWRQFLEDIQGELGNRMAPITSLVSVPPLHNASAPIAIYHKSLIDFLYAEARCGDLFVDQTTFNVWLTDRIVAVLKNKGPVVTLPSPATDWDHFMHHFQRLKLVGSSSTLMDPNCRVSQQYAAFLGFLNSSSEAELASCDVVWWTGLLLAEFAIGSALSPGLWFSHFRLLGGIYCGIHKAMGCDSVRTILSDGPSPNSRQTSTPGSPTTKCRPGCILWRNGIMARAKGLNWCVHEIEGIEVSELEDLNFLEFRQKFKKVEKAERDGSCSTCAVCQSISNGKA